MFFVPSSFADGVRIFRKRNALLQTTHPLTISDIRRSCTLFFKAGVLSYDFFKETSSRPRVTAYSLEFPGILSGIISVQLAEEDILP